MSLSKNEKAFLIGLEKLTRETGIIIHGCGCCGSPSLCDEKDAITSDDSGYGFGYTDEVCWIDPSDKYDWERFRKSIVKE